MIPSHMLYSLCRHPTTGSTRFSSTEPIDNVDVLLVLQKERSKKKQAYKRSV
jgi:hypothetical protein